VTKAQLIGIVAKKFQHLPRSKIKDMVDAVFDSISGALSKDCRIEVRGFGVFNTKIRRAREGRNPRTGGKVDVPKKRVPSFRAGKDLRDRANSALRRKERK
jgi:integration host factor subunit beta